MEANKCQQKQRLSKENKMKQTLTVSEVARMLQMSKTSIYKYAEAGKLPSVKIGSNLRFTDDQINQFIATHTKSFNTNPRV
jgi:excisionase family DNA binding protein